MSLELIRTLRKVKLSLKKLYITQKTPVERRVDANKLHDRVKAVIEKTQEPTQKELYEPEHLVCNIGGFLMDDPVTL